MPDECRGNGYDNETQTVYLLPRPFDSTWTAALAGHSPMIRDWVKLGQRADVGITPVPPAPHVRQHTLRGLIGPNSKDQRARELLEGVSSTADIGWLRRC